MSVLGKNPNSEERKIDNGGESTKNAAPKIKDIEKWTNKNKEVERKGRTPKVDEYVRKPRITIYANDEELRKLKEAAKEHGVSVSAYILMKLVYNK